MAATSTMLELGTQAPDFDLPDVTTGRRACPRTEVGVGTRARAVIDTPGFYGAIGADALVFASAALSPRLEVFGTLEAFHFQFVQTATLTATSGTLGQLTAGAALLTLSTERLALTTVGRAMPAR